MAKKRVGGKAARRGDTHKLIPGLRALENSIRRNKTETAYVYGADGKLLFSQDGTEKEVHFTSEQGSAMEGGILTHNHPGKMGNGFSRQDVNLLISRNLLEMRAVHRDGIHSLKRMREVGELDRLSFASLYLYYYENYVEAERSLADSLQRDFDKGKISRNKINQEYHTINMRIQENMKDWLRNNAEKHGYRYTVERG